VCIKEVVMVDCTSEHDTVLDMYCGCSDQKDKIGGL